MQNGFAAEWANNTIIGLRRKKIIKPAVDYPYNFSLKRIANAEKIDFTDFLAESGCMAENENMDLIKRFDNSIDAQEKISLCAKS